MSPQEFKNNWVCKGVLSPLQLSRLTQFNLKPETIEFLTTVGLPTDAAPFLSFVEDSQDKFKGIARLKEQYDLPEPELEKWIVIGSCADGDPIAINVDSNDRIEWLDHENYFAANFFNSSVSSMANCLVVYRDFVSEVNQASGEDAWLNGNFSDIQFDALKVKLLEADSRALESNGFWEEQLNINLAMRRAFLKGEL